MIEDAVFRKEVVAVYLNVYGQLKKSKYYKNPLLIISNFSAIQVLFENV
jgi:hypothetical protein